MAKHTPGPWECRKSRQEGMYQVVCGTFYVQGLMGEANARLIAAAPELLEALEELYWLVDERQRLGRFVEIYDKAKAAIAAARGEDVDPHKQAR